MSDIPLLMLGLIDVITFILLAAACCANHWLLLVVTASAVIGLVLSNINRKD